MRPAPPSIRRACALSGVGLFMAVPAAAPLRAAEPAAAPAPRYNLTCLAPILDKIDADAPADLSQAYLFGPWQRPAMRHDLGKVSFPLSSASADLQAVFNQGVASLHHFAYADAERCFRAATTIDPQHPMPYWGLALANERRPNRAAFFAAEAERRSYNRGDLSGLEREWIKAVVEFYRGVGTAWDRPPATLTAEDLRTRRRTLVRTLEQLAFAHPDSAEVIAALLRRVVVDHHQAGEPIASYFANNLLADRLEELAPDHPGRHYRLFLWLGQDPARAVPHAAAAPTVSPGAAHAWRYAAETFRAAGRLPEAVEVGKRAIRCAHREMERRGEPMPDRIEDLTRHYEAYIDDLTAMGRFAEARQAARQLIGLPRTFYRERRHTHAQRLAGSFFTGRRLLGQLHVRLELWEKLLAECESGFLAPLPNDPVTAIESQFWRGIAHCNLGDTDRAGEMVEAMSTGLRAAKSEGISDDAEEFMVHLARTVRTHAEFSTRTRTRLPDKDYDLTYLPREHLARLYFHAGLKTEALAVIDAELAARPGQFVATATYSDLHFRAGNSRQAFYAFTKSFRATASLAHARLPVLQRLKEVASAMRLPAIWHLPAPPPEGLEALPAADGLGPLAWAPPAAPKFSRPGPDGGETTLTDYSGTPVILNFFLGAGCAYCRRQMDLFTPALPKFQEAGIAILGVTTDTMELLRKVLETHERDLPDAPPLYAFPVVCDPQALVFKSFGAFEEFEDRPIHGTILVDGSGRILWRDAGHEPFNHPIQLLREAERLLQIHTPQDGSSPSKTSQPSQP